MTSRERWTIYPLLFLALGMQFRNKVVGIEAKVVQCESLTITDQAGTPVARLHATAPNRGQLEFFDPKGKAVLIAGSTADSQAGFLHVQNSTHTGGVAIVAGANELGGHIEAFSASGSVVFRMIPEGKVLTLSAIDPKTNIRTVWVPQIVQQISSPKTSPDDGDKRGSKSKEPKSDQKESTEAEAKEAKENE
jgi:hypothetical protein